MPAGFFVLVAASTGFISGIVQFGLFASSMHIVESFSEHLDELRAHVRVALVLLAAFLIIAIVYEARTEFVQLIANAFTLSWIAGVALACRVFLSHNSIAQTH